MKRPAAFHNFPVQIFRLSMATQNAKKLCCFIGITIALLFAGVHTVCAQANWTKRGSEPGSYALGIDSSEQYNNQFAATLKSTAAEIRGFGNARQNISPAPYAGKRIRMTAYMKTKDVANWAAFWLRIDREGKPLVMDNMENRPVKGTTDWEKYTLVVDVEGNASDIVFGVMLIGTGQIWFTNPVFEIVDGSVPTTEQHRYD